MEVDGCDIDFLDVPLADQPQAVKALIADPRTRDGGSSLTELEKRRRLSQVSESSDALNSQTSHLKSLARREVSVIGAAGGQPRAAVVGAEQGGGIPGAVVLGVTH